MLKSKTRGEVALCRVVCENVPRLHEAFEQDGLESIQSPNPGNRCKISAIFCIVKAK